MEKGQQFENFLASGNSYVEHLDSSEEDSDEFPTDIYIGRVTDSDQFLKNISSNLMVIFIFFSLIFRVE